MDSLFLLATVQHLVTPQMRQPQILLNLRTQPENNNLYEVKGTYKKVKLAKIDAANTNIQASFRIQIQKEANIITGLAATYHRAQNQYLCQPEGPDGCCNEINLYVYFICSSDETDIYITSSCSSFYQSCLTKFQEDTTPNHHYYTRL